MTQQPEALKVYNDYYYYDYTATIIIITTTTYTGAGTGQRLESAGAQRHNRPAHGGARGLGDGTSSQIKGASASGQHILRLRLLRLLLLPLLLLLLLLIPLLAQARALQQPRTPPGPGPQLVGRIELVGRGPWPKSLAMGQKQREQRARAVAKSLLKATYPTPPTRPRGSAGRYRAPRGSAIDDEDETWGDWKAPPADTAADIEGVEAAPAADEAAENERTEETAAVIRAIIGEVVERRIGGEAAEIGGVVEPQQAAQLWWRTGPCATCDGNWAYCPECADLRAAKEKEATAEAPAASDLRSSHDFVFCIPDSDEEVNVAAKSLTPRRRCRTKRRAERVDSPRRVERRTERHEQKRRAHRTAQEARREVQLRDGIPLAEEAVKAVVIAAAIAGKAVELAQNTLARIAVERGDQFGLGNGLQYPLMTSSTQVLADAVAAAAGSAEYTLTKLNHLRVVGMSGLETYTPGPDAAAAEVEPAPDATAAESDPAPAAAAAQQPQPRQPRPQDPHRFKGFARWLWWREHQRRQQAAWAGTGGGGCFYSGGFWHY
jgi:hypothetical protein